MSDNLRKRTSSGTTPPSKRNGSGGSAAAGGGHARARSDGAFVRASSTFVYTDDAHPRAFVRQPFTARHAPKMIGDEKPDEGGLDDQIDMKDWEFLGPPGSYADGVFKGFQRSNLAEVAVKVVSTQNTRICESQWVQEKLAELEKTSGKRVTDEQRFKVYEEKVLREMYNTQTLSSPYICEFFGCFRESTSYLEKVVNKKDHAIHQYFRVTVPPEPERPYPQRSFFFVMENLSGGDLFEYNASSNYGCGFLLAFEASPQATESLIHEALGRFPPFPAALDDPETKAYKEFMYLDDPFLHDHKGSRFLVLKFNTNYQRDLKYKVNPQHGIHAFSKDIQDLLIKEKLICNCAPGQKVLPLPLFFDETFIRKTLKHIMVALCHAHGAPIFHNDLKPDNIMFKQRVHAHATHDGSKICAKIIDWGCGGWSKESENETSHPYKPKPEELPGEPVDVFCVGNTLLFLFNGEEWRETSAGEFQILPKKFTRPLKCLWNKNPDFQDLDPKFCVPWNPNEDKDFKELVQRMVNPNSSRRITVKNVLRHRFMLRKEAGQAQASDVSNPHVTRLNDLLYNFAPPYLQKMHDSHNDKRTEETKFLDLLVSDHLPGLRRSLDLLVMLPLLIQAPYAQAFVESNLVTQLSNFVHTYFERDEYPHRHLPRTMVLLSHLASHQSVFFLGKIVAATYPSRQDSDGRALLDLIAYGVFDCHDPDPNHKACSLYTMLMIIALSSPGDDPGQSSCVSTTTTITTATTTTTTAAAVTTFFFHYCSLFCVFNRATGIRPKMSSDFSETRKAKNRNR
jgi:serine/threonine protein kinase